MFQTWRVQGLYISSYRGPVSILRKHGSLDARSGPAIFVTINDRSDLRVDPYHIRVSESSVSESHDIFLNNVSPQASVLSTRNVADVSSLS